MIIFFSLFRNIFRGTDGSSRSVSLCASIMGVKIRSHVLLFDKMRIDKMFFPFLSDFFIQLFDDLYRG